MEKFIWVIRKMGKKIVVKILHEMLAGHADERFQQELYNLANLKHQNIVRLIGYCHETQREVRPYEGMMVFAEVQKRALCFEFMENGSLSNYLFDEFNGHGWRTRYAIIKGICNGLKYLHEELKLPVFCFGLKPTNILLDKNMIPKLADVGLSRLFMEENSHITNSPIGTHGYLQPEYIKHNIMSNTTDDIFSLGVIIKNIIAGPISAEMTRKQYTENVHANWRNRLEATSGDLLEWYSEQVKTCIKISLSCVKTNRKERPSIGHIVNMLTKTEKLENHRGPSIDQMSTYAVKDTYFIDVRPLQLHFSFRPNKLTSCPFHVTNNMDDHHVAVRCVPKHQEATRYYAYLGDIFGVVPPRSTHTFVVTMKEVQQPPADMGVLDIGVQTFLGGEKPNFCHVENHFEHVRKQYSHGFREVTLKVVCTTTCETMTSEVDGHVKRSTDVHPTEPCYRLQMELMLLDENAGPLPLPLLFLQDITNHFSPLQEIGRGGFAVVYKGMVGKSWVAVKKMTRTHDLPENKFHKEVQCLVKAKHKNIVRFLGYCIETQGEVADCKDFIISDRRNWLLCFEYLPNGSLENYITDASSGLKWTERFRIIKGICEGLHYLHMKRILHLDLKPANILLDSHMVPKIADFGLSRCLDENKTHATTTIHMSGTLGYMAPEVLCRGKITFASDIYSLGSVIMEILTGLKGHPQDENVTGSWMHRLEGGNQLEQVRVCTEIAMECMEFDPQKRPVALHIIDMLEETDETATSSSLVRLKLSLPNEQFLSESLKLPEDIEERPEFEDAAEHLGNDGEENKERQPSPEVQINHKRTSIFSSNSSVLDRLNIFNVFRSDARRYFVKNGGGVLKKQAE